MTNSVPLEAVLFNNWHQLRIIKETSAIDGFDVKKINNAQQSGLRTELA